MTIEEAIQHCEEVAAGRTEQGKCPECAADHRQLAEWLRELVALCARKPCILDRSRWEECADCWLWERHSFCPDCGRPLTEEAWAELERKIGGDIYARNDTP